MKTFFSTVGAVVVGLLVWSVVAPVLTRITAPIAAIFTPSK